MALYPLCDHERRPRDAIVHTVGAIESKIPAGSEQGEFLTLLGVFGRLSYPSLDVRKIIGLEKMKESRFYQEILQEGRKESALLTRRADSVRFLQARFKTKPPAAIVTALDAIDDTGVLDELVDLAATCESMNDFQTDPRLRQTA